MTKIKAYGDWVVLEYKRITNSGAIVIPTEYQDTGLPTVISGPDMDLIGKRVFVNDYDSIELTEHKDTVIKAVQIGSIIAVL